MTDSGGNIFSRIPSYSVILIMIVMVVIGAGIMPLLNIQYTPSSKQNSLSVNFRWNGASARVIDFRTKRWLRAALEKEGSL